MLPDGTRDILGIWIESTEGAKFWMKVFNDLKTRGCNDMLMAVTDGWLEGYGYMWEYPITCAYADARVQRIYGGTNEIMDEVISRSMGLGGK